jgi:hypothetical protein
MATRPSAGGDGLGEHPRAWRLLCAAAIGLISVTLLAGCGAKGDKGNLEAAKAAIAADPDLEIMATDEANGVITVRIKSTGQLTVVKAADLKPGVALVVKPPAAAAPAAADAGAARPVPSDGRASLTVTGNTGGVTVKGGGAQGGGSVEAGSTAGGGVQVKDAAGAQITMKDGRIQARQGGQSVALDGSGVTLNADGTVTLGAGGAKVAPRQPPAGGRTAAADNKTRRTSPVFCRAASEVRLDNVFLDVAGGDAINAEGGCTLWIRHSQVSAGGWGLIVQGGATIVIENSVIEGRSGSMSIQDGGEVSSLSSTFRGRFARRPEAEFTDKGGNSFQ